MKTVVIGMGARVLIIDDEPEIRKLLQVGLNAHDYECFEASTGREGLAVAAYSHPDIVILDMGLPDMDGIGVVKAIREWSSIPIIILSVREQERDKIQALDEGADDYLTKPFSMGELLARIRVALRHQTNTGEEPVLEIGDLTIDLSKRKLTVKGNEIRLTPIEYDLFKCLALHAGKVMTHRQLLTSVWGKDRQEENHYLRIYIRQLRKKIEADPTRPRYILTEPGIGYRLAESEFPD